MRTDLELWLIVEQNFDEYFKRCLCDTIRLMYESDLLTYKEDLYLRNIIYEYGKRRFFNRPVLDPFTHFDLIWKRWHKKPRKMFIQKQILKLIRDEKRN